MVHVDTDGVEHFLMKMSLEGLTSADKEVALELVFSLALESSSTGKHISKGGCELLLCNVPELDKDDVDALSDVIRMHGTKWLGDHDH